MRVVIALGGNALAAPGAPVNAESQRANIATAAAAIADIARAHEVVITHGNGPQIGWLAAQQSVGRNDAGLPLDVLGAESEGVIGYKEDRGQIYVHLGGRTKSGLVLDKAAPPSPHLHLVSSSSNVDFQTLTARSAKFTTGGVKNVSVVLGGAAPGSSWDITVAGIQTQTTADSTGQIELDVPKDSAVDVIPHPAP